MDTSDKAREQISALADGELDDPYISVTLASLRQQEGKNDWELYHRIGDVLRSEDMDISLSSGFAARMAARLEQEPAIVAPAAISVSRATADRRPDTNGQTPTIALRSASRRWALPGVAAAAAVAAIAFVTTPHLMVALNKGDDANLSAADGSPSAVVATHEQEGVVLRDARIDDYLLAHQRFSPSVYSTAQYARSATFAVDSNK